MKNPCSCKNLLEVDIEMTGQNPMCSRNPYSLLMSVQFRLVVRDIVDSVGIGHETDLVGTGPEVLTKKSIRTDYPMLRPRLTLGGGPGAGVSLDGLYSLVCRWWDQTVGTSPRMWLAGKRGARAMGAPSQPSRGDMDAQASG
jgi:hypothetical protein